MAPYSHSSRGSGRPWAGAWLALLAVTACASPPSGDPAPGPEPPSVDTLVAPETESPEVIPTVMVPEPEPEPEPEAPEPEPVDDSRPWAERTLEGMTVRQKVAQLIMPSLLGNYAPVGSAAHSRAVEMVEEYEVGGLLMSVGTPSAVALKLNDLQRRSKVPLLVSADLETGAGFRFHGAVQMPGTMVLGGATDFPQLMAVGAAGDPDLAYEMGRITALEARALGIHLPFAPVLDVNNNPDNPIINVRSLGADPGQVSVLGAALVRGMEEHGAMSTGKHFPGHGDTDTDTHQSLPTIRHARERLDSVELRPFQAAIDAGASGIMTAHITVPALNGGNGDPATLSAAVLTDLLRGEMGFDGLVITDAMDMGALTRNYRNGEAAVRAVEAGADLLIQPLSVPQVLNALEKAVEDGRISEERIDDSALRILRAKETLRLHEAREVDPDAITDVVGIPEHQRVAEELAEASITLLRNGGGLLPLRGTRSARVLSVSYRRTSDVLGGRYFNQRLRRTYPRLSTVTLDADSGSGLYEGLLRQARRSQLVIVSVYVTAVSYQGAMAVPDELADFIAALDEAGVPHLVVSFGNPYLVRDFAGVRAYLLAWDGAAASQRAAAGALFGDFEIRGHTPTPIPPLFELGAGIRLPAKAPTGND